MKKSSKPAALDVLSARERQVLKLVVEGKTSKEIAVIVGVKPSSIDTYRSRIMAKLDVGDLPNLVRFAIRHGVIKA
jgi:DNA-binding CsgD family transcriptional regulator